jgi:hypothetical protein
MLFVPDAGLNTTLNLNHEKFAAWSFVRAHGIAGALHPGCGFSPCGLFDFD